MTKEKEKSAYEGSTSRAKTVETTRRRSAASEPSVKGANRIADEASAQYSNVEDPRAVETTKKSGGRPKTVEPRRSSAPARIVAAQDADEPIVRKGVDSSAVKTREESRGRAPSRKNKPKIIEVIEVSSREVTLEPLGPATNRPIALRAENKRAKSRKRNIRSEEEREKEMIRLGVFLSDSEEPVTVEEEEANGQGGDQENNRLSPTDAALEMTEEKEDVQEPQSKRHRA